VRGLGGSAPARAALIREPLASAERTEGWLPLGRRWSALTPPSVTASTLAAIRGPGLDEGVGAGTLDAVACAGALVVGLAAFGVEGGAVWRRAIEVFIVFFEGAGGYRSLLRGGRCENETRRQGVLGRVLTERSRAFRRVDVARVVGLSRGSWKLPAGDSVRAGARPDVLIGLCNC